MGLRPTVRANNGSSSSTLKKQTTEHTDPQPHVISRPDQMHQSDLGSHFTATLSSGAHSQLSAADSFPALNVGGPGQDCRLIIGIVSRQRSLR